MDLLECKHCHSQLVNPCFLPCHHLFCTNCICPLLEVDPLCPFCRCPASSGDVVSCQETSSLLKLASSTPMIPLSELETLIIINTTTTSDVRYCKYNGDDVVFKQFKNCHDLAPLACSALVKSSAPLNIFVPILGVTQNPLGIVMAKYSSLETLLDNGTVFDFQRACLIATDISNALAFLHSREFVHGDVRPQNVYCVDTFEHGVKIGLGT
ncbi:hypothetical protein RCL1_007328 [Eukaryota sp. TZLM3-RCL]